MTSFPIKNWPTPTIVTEVQNFLGFTNHLKCFTHKYAHIVHPLHVLTDGDNANKRKQKVEWRWECDESFQKLKEICSSTPILTYAIFPKPFVLHTDTHGLGLRVMLQQQYADDTDRVIAYASHTLSKSERNYPAHKLEFLSLK